MNYWTRQQWREWFRDIDKDMEENLGIWYRIYVRKGAEAPK